LPIDAILVSVDKSRNMAKKKDNTVKKNLDLRVSPQAQYWLSSPDSLKLLKRWIERQADYSNPPVYEYLVKYQVAGDDEIYVAKDVDISPALLRKRWKKDGALNVRIKRISDERTD
jgi:hypothetical protein